MIEGATCMHVKSMALGSKAVGFILAIAAKTGKKKFELWQNR